MMKQTLMITMIDFGETHKKALKHVKSMINRLENERWYYDADFECEYTPFEEDIKNYCETYCEYYLTNNQGQLFFDSLKRIVNAIGLCEAEMYEEDFFRPAELITYYLGKIITADDDLKTPICDWILDFSAEFEENFLAEDYFMPFIKGEKIYHADNYYTGYRDLNRMLKVFK